MSLGYIIDALTEKYGFDEDDQRAMLVRKINRAAREIYESQDLPGCLKEIVFNVGSNSVIALPSYVGELRAVRGRDMKEKVELKDMVPQYKYESWGEINRVWRLLGKSPIKKSIITAAGLTVTIPVVEATSIIVTVIGETVTSKRRSESITITAGNLTATGAVAFLDVHSIVKNRVTTYDVTVKDSSNNELSVIPNNELSSSYILVDVSAIPSAGSSTNTRQVDVLYKQNLLPLANDDDEFPCPGFDDAIVYKTLEHVYSMQADGGDKAMGFYQKCVQVIHQRIVHSNGPLQKEMIFKPNPMLGLFSQNIPLWIWRNR